MIVPVILAGGNGSRLWPLSRELYPKQFLKLDGEYSLLQNTILRLNKIQLEKPIVICNEEHRFLVAEQLRQIGQLDNNIILEPVGKNTAPAITLAAIYAKKYNTDPLLLVLAADHMISDENIFLSTIRESISIAKSGNLVTFGVIPNFPETGYGYIKRGNKIPSSDQQIDAYVVERFVEKPDIALANEYLSSGQYYWNSGIFIFSRDSYIKEISKYRMDIFEACEQSMLGISVEEKLDFIRIDELAFNKCPSESIDYAVMENTSNSVVMPLDSGWSDIGSWSALWDISEKDNNNNVIIGDVFNSDTTNCYVRTEEQFVSVIGASNLIIVSTKDAILVIDKNHVQKVKDVVNYLKCSERIEHKIHRENYKTWGMADKIVRSERYQVNRLKVNPGDKISSQMHHHKSEHWIVLSGTAKVILDNEEFLLTENQSTFIPVGSIHTLINPGKIPLDILEIQSGDYISDDDIIRF